MRSISEALGCHLFQTKMPPVEVFFFDISSHCEPTAFQLHLFMEYPYGWGCHHFLGSQYWMYSLLLLLSVVSRIGYEVTCMVVAREIITLIFINAGNKIQLSNLFFFLLSAVHL